MAKSTGKRFEEEFIASAPENVYVHRLVDPVGSYSGGSNLRFASKNPFDFMIYDYPHLYCLELKSSTTNSFSFPTIEEVDELNALTESHRLVKRSKDKDSIELSKKELNACKKALKSRNIKEHQIQGLKEAKDKKCISWFIFNFSKDEYNATYAIDIDSFLEFRETCEKKSINQQDIIELVENNNNCIQIYNEPASTRKGTKKRKYYFGGLGIHGRKNAD